MFGIPFSRSFSALFVLSLAVSGVAVDESAAETIEHSVRVAATDVSVVRGSSSDEVLLDGRAAEKVTQGQPELPFRLIRLVLPQGYDVDHAQFSATGRALLAKDVHVPRAAAPVTADGEAAPQKTTDYDPGVRGVYLGTGVYHGYYIASFAVYPLAAESDGLYLYDDIHISATTRPHTATVTTRERLREGFRASVAKRVRDMVDNPDAVANYAFNEVRVEDNNRGFAPTIFPSLEGSPVDYVIITPDSLSATFQTLADFKTEKGVPTVVRTTEWIEANYRNGADDAETIRNFIKDAYAKWGITYVLLGGDSDMVPIRLAWAGFYDGGRFLPVDMYFGCLDGDWNADHDDRFGEGDDDKPDLYAEVYAGRSSARNNLEAATLIGKVIEYENGTGSGFGKRVLYLSEVLFPADWEPGQTIFMDGADVTEFIRLASVTDSTLEQVRMFENYTAFPGAIQLTRAGAIDSINAGFNHVMHSGHGFRFNMSVGNGSILNGDAAALTNTGRLSNLFLLNCTACAFTYDSLGEEFLRNPNGGAVTVIGSNESAFPITSSNYMRDYYDLIFQQDVLNVGQAFADCRLNRTPYAELGDTGDLWAHYILTLLGEPEMPLWTNEVKPLTVTHTAGVGMGTTAILVTVLDSGSPVSGATVCLSKDDDDYQVGTTDGAGEVTLNFRAESAGDIKVVATGKNYMRHESTISVSSVATTYVSYYSMTVDDDSTGGTAGNGDGVVDAGETVGITIEVENSGDTGSGNIDLVLSTPYSGVTITDSTSSVGSIGAASTKTAVDPMVIAFSSSLPDGSVIEFTLTVKEDGTPTWTDKFKKVIHGPSLSSVTLRIDDSEFGNDDGVVDADETFRLYATVKNFGTGAASVMDGDLVDMDDGFVFTDSSDTWGALATVTEGENLGGFLIREPDVGSEHRLQLLLTDIYGRVYRDTLELRPPTPPDSIQFDPSLGPDRLSLSWVSSDTTVASYNIYRSETPGGPYTLVNVDPVYHSIYLDTGLNATTEYCYVLRSIDESGNLSAQSPEYCGSTNPPQLAGWPINMSLETSCSPVAGDLDGDGDLEVVQGDKQVYAWHHDGIELVDGDHNALTWGVLSSRGQDFVSHIALGRMDSQPGLDVVAASRTTQEVYVFNASGDTIPGWPQPVLNTIRAGVVVGDIDGDNLDDVIAIDEQAVLYVWHRDGTEMIDGDGNPSTNGVFKVLPGGGFHYSTPSVADIDGDNSDEIIVGNESDSLWVLNGDGSVRPGFPVYLGSDIAGSPAIGDVDGDGDFEIVVCSSAGLIRALRDDGSVLWIRSHAAFGFFAPSPALADVNGNGKLETFVAISNGNLYAIDYQGNILSGWPVVYNDLTTTESSPVIADIDGDGFLDILLGDEERVINAWDRNGVLLDGFPLTCGDAVRGTPMVTDLDGDGDVELIASSWDKHVYVWDFNSPYDPALAPWAGYQANTRNNGTTGFEVPTGIFDVSFMVDIRGGAVDLHWHMESMAGRAFDIYRASGSRDAVSVGDFHIVARGVQADIDGVLHHVDRSAQPGERYVYRIEAVNDATAQHETPSIYVPVEHADVTQNYPNPFNPSTTITYFVPEGVAQRVSLVLYNVRGARVKTLVDATMRAGKYSAQWDGRNDNGARVSSGVYFYRFTHGDFVKTRKMLLLK